VPPSPLVYPWFPVVGVQQQKHWHLSDEKTGEYQESFPGLAIEAVLRHAWQWCMDNPSKRKTPGGMPGFLTRWLGREQNRTGGTSGNPPTANRVDTPAAARFKDWEESRG